MARIKAELPPREMRDLRQARGRGRTLQRDPIPSSSVSQRDEKYNWFLTACWWQRVTWWGVFRIYVLVVDEGLEFVRMGPDGKDASIPQKFLCLSVQTKKLVHSVACTLGNQFRLSTHHCSHYCSDKHGLNTCAYQLSISCDSFYDSLFCIFVQPNGNPRHWYWHMFCIGWHEFRTLMCLNVCKGLGDFSMDGKLLRSRDVRTSIRIFRFFCVCIR